MIRGRLPRVGCLWPAAIGLAVAFSLLASGAADAATGTDLLGSLTPGSLGGGIAERYPLSRFALDYSVDTGTLGLGDPSASIGMFLASLVWQFTLLLVNGTIHVVVWAFTFGLVSAALDPVVRTINSLRDHVVGDEYTAAAVSLLGIWATIKMAQRRTTEMFGGIALSVAFTVLALFFVAQPREAISGIAKAADGVALSILIGESPDAPATAKAHLADRLFTAQILKPWELLEFSTTGRICTDARKRSVPENDPHRAVCHPVSKYAERFLAQPAGSKARNAEFLALRDGQIPTTATVQGGSDQGGAVLPHGTNPSVPIVDLST